VSREINAMRREPETDTFGNELFLAGQHAPRGRYKQLDGTYVIELEHEDVLPAALDGRATCYTRVPATDFSKP
jgi:hypothetical protein